MPLSDHEQRLLEQIEQALYAEDPKFAHHYRSTDLRTLRRARLIKIGIILALGAAVLAVGLWRQIMLMVVGGGAVMAGALVLTASTLLRFRPPRQPGPDAVRARPPVHRSLRRRLEDRWERRWEQRGL